LNCLNLPKRATETRIHRATSLKILCMLSLESVDSHLFSGFECLFFEGGRGESSR